MCDVVVYYCLRAAVIVDRERIVLNTHYSVEPACSLLEFVVHT